MATNVDLLGRICRQSIRTGQVSDIETVALVAERARLGVDRYSTIIADVFVPARKSIEQRGFATIGIADQRDIDYSAVGRNYLFDLLLLGHHVAIGQLLDHILRLSFGYNLDHLGLATT